jgi:hypothetical protein
MAAKNAGKSAAFAAYGYNFAGVYIILQLFIKLVYTVTIILQNWPSLDEQCLNCERG